MQVIPVNIAPVLITRPIFGFRIISSALVAIFSVHLEHAGVLPLVCVV